MQKLFALVVLALIATSAQAQTANSSAASPDLPVIKSTTRLVQVSVVVTDKAGKPIQGLKKEDFTLLDGGKPQEVRFFSSAGEAKPGRSLPPNVFSNRNDVASVQHAPTTIILIDSLNTEPSDQVYAREQLKKALLHLPPHAHVAIYELGSTLRILSEFTSSDATLRKVMSGVMTVEPSPLDPMRPRNAQDRDQLRTEYAEARIIPLASAFIAIANRVAEVPGRKDLIWITGGVRLQFASEFKIRLRTLGYLGGGPEFAESGYELFRAAAESMNVANVAFYGVDVHGATVDPGIAPQTSAMSMSPRASLRGAQRGLSAEQSMRDSYRMLADRTGGLAFYGGNDVSGAVQRALNDENDSYVLGYYPSHHDWNGKFRKIAVRTNVAGATARYRDGYYATTGEQAEFQDKAELQLAITSPVDLNPLGLKVSGRPTQPPQPGVLEFQVGVDLAQLALQSDGTNWKGEIDLIFAQRNASGQTLALDAKRIEVNLTNEKREELLKKGAVFERHLVILQGAEDVRVVVREPSTSTYGTVTVPLQMFFPRS